MIRKLIICIAVLVGFCPMAWGTVDDVPNPKTYNADNWVSDPDHILDSETKNKINDISVSYTHLTLPTICSV